MIDERSLDALFRNARTANGFLDEPVTDAQIQAIYELMKWPPTSMNCEPARLVFLKSQASRERLRAALSPGNLEKTLKAPMTVIIAHDTQFHEHLPKLFPHNQNAKAIWDGDEKRVARETMAFRNGSLQGAYFIMAARAVGLDCGPMSGFDNAKVDAEFFPGGRIRSNFLCNLGKIDPSKTFARSPRLEFGEACQVL